MHPSTAQCIPPSFYVFFFFHLGQGVGGCYKNQEAQKQQQQSDSN